MNNPRAHGAPVLEATIRSRPEDFVVEEQDAFAASGEGEHLMLTVRKRGMNTAYAAAQIAQWAEVAESAVGYAGLKDRHAITRQRFSVWLPRRKAPDPALLEQAQRGELEVLEAHWHTRKLARGALAGNRFVLTLRDMRGERAAIEARAAAICAHGVPNYFGEQRFGRHGDNVAQALAMFAGRRKRRAERSVLLSAARSALFNQVLAARVHIGHWNRPLEGEAWVLNGSRSVFGPEPWSDALAARLAAFDIHPSAPLWGRGALRSACTAQRFELENLSAEAWLALRSGLEAAGLRQERRACRLPVPDLKCSWEAEGPGTMRLAFALPPGSYATAVLDEFGDYRNANVVTAVQPAA